jgi:hypothetical protein
VELSGRDAAAADATLSVHEGGPGGRVVAQSHPVSATQLEAEWDGTPGVRYLARVSLLSGGAQAGGYRLSILRPCE